MKYYFITLANITRSLNGLFTSIYIINDCYIEIETHVKLLFNIRFYNRLVQPNCTMGHNISIFDLTGPVKKIRISKKKLSTNKMPKIINFIYLSTH